MILAMDSLVMDTLVEGVHDISKRLTAQLKI